MVQVLVVPKTSNILPPYMCFPMMDNYYTPPELVNKFNKNNHISTEKFTFKINQRHILFDITFVNRLTDVNDWRNTNFKISSSSMSYVNLLV